MATCFAGDARSVDAALRYNTEKDGRARDAEKVLVEGVGCDAETAQEEMAAMRQYWGKDSGLQAYTFLQSFSPQDMESGLTMARANQIGRDTLETFMAMDGRGYAAGAYQATVCTQCDGESGLIHNHIVINNLDVTTGKKLAGMHQALWDFRECSDERCRAAGLSVVGEKSNCDVRYTHTEGALADKGVRSWKEQIRLALEQEMPLSRTADELSRRLARRGIGMELRGKKHVTYSIMDGGKMRKARGRSLGGAYDRAAVDGLTRSYDGRAAELHCSWASVVKSHPEMKTKTDYDRVARRAVAVWDNAARRHGHKVPRRRTKKGLVTAGLRAMKASAFLVRGGVALPLRVSGKALQGVGNVARFVPIVGAPVSVVLTGVGKGADDVGKKINDGAKSFSKAVDNLDKQVKQNGGGGGNNNDEGRDLLQNSLDEKAKGGGGGGGSGPRLDADDDMGLKNWSLMSELEKDEMRNKELMKSI